MAVIVIILLILGNGAPAGAIEPIGEYNPIYEWDEAQWEQASAWPDEQWIDFFAWSVKYYDGNYENYWEYWESLEAAQSTWTGQQWALYSQAESLFWTEYDKQHLIEYRLQLGFPYIDGINVKVNGSFIKDAAPVVVDNCTMVSAQGLVKLLGGELSYSENSNRFIIHLNDAILTMTLGQTAMTLQQGSQSGTWQLDVAPYRENAIIYVPIRSVANALDLELFWNDYEQLVVLIDRAALISAIDQKFSIINRLLEQQNHDFLTQTMETNLSSNLTATLYGDGMDDSQASVNISGHILSQANNAAAEMNMKIDISQLREILSYFEMEEDLNEFTATWSNMELRMLINAEDQSFYLQSDMLTQEYPQLNKNTWIRFDMDYSEWPAFSELVWSVPPTIGTMIYSMTSYNSYNYSDLYEDTMNLANICQVVCGDQYFKTTKNGAVTTYTLTHNQISLAKACLDLGLEIPSDLLLSDQKLPEVNYTLVLTERAGELSYAVNAAANFPSLPIEFSLEMTGDKNSSSSHGEFKGLLLGKLVFDSNSNMKPTSKSFSVIPDGEVVDYYDLFYSDIYYDYEYEYDYMEGESAGQFIWY